MIMSSLRFVIFLGSVRDGNFGQRAAKFMVKKLEARGHQTTLLGKDAALDSFLDQNFAQSCCSTVDCTTAVFPLPP